MGAGAEAGAGPLLLGIDVGSSRVKAVLVSADGDEVGLGEAATPFTSGGARAAAGAGEGAEMAVDDLLATLGRVLDGLGDDRRRVAGVGITGIAESGAPVGDEGRPLAPVLAWHDPRGGETVDELEARFGEDLHLRIGQRLRTVSSVAKLGWLVGNGVEGVRRWLGVPELCLHALTGVQATEFSLAARTGCYDVGQRRWLPEVAGAIGVGVDVFPAAEPAGAAMAEVSAGGAAWSRLPAGVPVTLAGHDHLAGLAGAATAPDDLANSVGTAETVMATFPALPDVGRALALGAAVTVAPGGEAWAAMASGARAGIVLNAAARALGQPPAALDSLVEEAPGPAPGGDDRLDGARLVRALQEGGPLDLPAVPPGELWGSLLRALSERTWEAAGRLGELAGPRRRLVVFGGGSRSGPWLRAKASLAPSGLTVWRSPTGEAAARGAAVYAGMAAGWWPTPSDAPTPPPEPVGP